MLPGEQKPNISSFIHWYLGIDKTDKVTWTRVVKQSSRIVKRNIIPKLKNQMNDREIQHIHTGTTKAIILVEWLRSFSVWKDATVVL
jgi:hypothetical protein